MSERPTQGPDDHNVKNSNGDTWAGEIPGDLRVKAANGDISVDHAHDDVIAVTANADVRIGEVRRGSASLKTACGEIEIGIRAGTARRLDVHTSFGRVQNHMDIADSSVSSEERLDVHASTSYGDILIRRSQGSLTGEVRSLPVAHCRTPCYT